MRIPPNYEEMIREIKTVASKYGFLLNRDELTDYDPLWTGTGKGHHFDAHILLKRQSDDFMEDAYFSVNAGN